jgi:8-oxo-dGTP diphosphatase
MKTGRFIVASGPVIIENKKLLVIKGNKDDFYKIPGGTVEQGESLIDSCKREVKEEINADIEILAPLNPMIIYKNPQTAEEMTIVLIHYLAKLKNKEKIKATSPVEEIKWLSIEDIRNKKYRVAPNIEFLIKVGDIK